MTYGVDQCRICGVEIKPEGTGAMERYVADRKRRPTMTEARWRAAGFKAAPTRWQMVKPTDGCCRACMMKIGLKSVPFFRIVGGLAAVALVLALFVFFIGTTIN